jgi:hypothetical protein
MSSPKHKGRSTGRWVEWHAKVRQALISWGPWLVKTDLGAYFDNIDHATLFAELNRLGMHPNAVLPTGDLRDRVAIAGKGTGCGQGVGRSVPDGRRTGVQHGSRHADRPAEYANFAK